MTMKGVWRGTVLILLGIVLLLGNVGILNRDVWSILAQMWPVLLIALGIVMLCGDSPWAILGPLVLVAAVFWSVISSGGRFPGLTPGRAGVPFWGRTSIYSLPGSEDLVAGKLIIDLGRGDLALFGQAGELVVGRLSYLSRAEPVWSVEGQEGETVIGLRGAAGRGPFGGHRYQGSIQLNSAVNWELDLSLGVGRLHGDFRNLPVRKLAVEMGVGSIALTLPDRGLRGEVKIDGGVANVRLRAPREVGVRIRFTGGLGLKRLAAAGLKRRGTYWVSDNYDTAASAYDITVATGLNHIDFAYSDGVPLI